MILKGEGRDLHMFRPNRLSGIMDDIGHIPCSYEHYLVGNKMDQFFIDESYFTKKFIFTFETIMNAK